MRYIDTHAHLCDERLDAKAIVENLDGDELDCVITVSFDGESSAQNVEIAQKYERVYAAVGVHPHDAKSFNPELSEQLLQLAKMPKVVAYGEIGLDYHYDFSDRESQKRAFAAQLEMAHSLKLPVIIHSREAILDTNNILKENKHLILHGGVMHCYANGKDFVKFYEDLGLYISFAGGITFKNANASLEPVSLVSNNRILTETDCPYLTPHPFRGQTNYPKYVRYIADKIAGLRKISTEELCNQVALNVNNLFKIDTYVKK